MAMAYFSYDADDHEKAMCARSSNMRAKEQYEPEYMQPTDSIFQDFLRRKVHVLVAIVALGVGVDHPHVRRVIQTHLPPSPDVMVQQWGRAGRDSLPAKTLKLYTLAMTSASKFASFTKMHADEVV